MAREESIVNKIIPIDTIIEVANYLENQKEEYSKLFEIDQQKNKDLKYDEQVYEYKELNSKTEYTIRFKDGKEVTKSDYDWFINMLSNPKIIEHIHLILKIKHIMNICTYILGYIFMKNQQALELTEKILKNRCIEIIHI